MLEKYESAQMKEKRRSTMLLLKLIHTTEYLNCNEYILIAEIFNNHEMKVRNYKKYKVHPICKKVENLHTREVQ